MEKNVIQMPDLKYIPDPKGLGYAFYTNMLKNSNELAQIDGLTGEKDSFGQLLQRSVRVALHMKDRGVAPGNIVCICTFNHLNSCVPLIASMFIGAIYTSADPTLSINDTRYLLDKVQPKIIFVQKDFEEKIESVLSTIDSNAEVVVFGDTSYHTSYAKLLKRHEEESNFIPWGPKSLDDTALIAFTSGTTGFPKGICQTHYTLLCQTMNKTDGMVTPSALVLTYASPYWGVFNSILNISLIRGLARLVYPRYNPNIIWDMFKYKVTYIFMINAQMATMVKQGRPKHINSDALITIHIGGDIAQMHKVLEMKKMFPNTRVHLVYGQSEVPMALTFFNGTNPKEREMMRKKPMSVGTGLYGMCYKVIDVETQEILGPNQQGELCVKSKFQTNGYYKENSSIIWDSDGWLKTGDLGYYDEDYCFFVTDRIKEMFKYQQWHVIPSVLENKLCCHPAVACAVVVGAPHEVDTYHPMAFVVLKPNHRNVSETEIEKFLENDVHDSQRLRGGVIFVDTLPITPTGKVNRAVLKQLI